jgi:very-short-patch-repair endonuclease
MADTTFGAIAATAARSHGIFRRDDARNAGASDATLRRWVDERLLVRAHRDVFRIAGAPRTPEQRVMQACIVAGPAALASHLTAASLHRFDGFPPLRTSAAVEIVVPQQSRRRTNGVVVHRTDNLDSCDRCFVGAIPTTSPLRTLIDIATRVSRDRLEEALDGAERDGKVNRRVLERRLAQLRGRGRPGVAAISALLAGRARVATLPRSVLERRMLRLLAAHSLPVPICQYRVERLDGATAYLDFAYPDVRLAIEVDGKGHATLVHRSADDARTNALPGWRVLRFAYDDVTARPGHVAAVVGAQLRS